MKKIKEIALPVIITFFISYIINFSIYYIASNDGSIQLGSILNINNQNYMVCEFTNYSEKNINELKMSVPISTKVEDILSSTPLDISTIHSNINNNLSKLIEISGFVPFYKATFLIPIKNITEITLIKVLNAKFKKVDITISTEIDNPLKKVLKEALITASLYTIIFAIFFLIFQNNIDKRWSQLKEVNDGHKEIIKGLEKKIDSIHKSGKIIRGYILAKTTDYIKELDFWRDTIRKILYFKDKKIDSDEIFKIVTDNLKTYSTLHKSYDYEALKYIKDINKENEL